MIPGGILGIYWKFALGLGISPPVIGIVLGIHLALDLLLAWHLLHAFLLGDDNQSFDQRLRFAFSSDKLWISVPTFVLFTLCLVLQGVGVMSVSTWCILVIFFVPHAVVNFMENRDLIHLSS